jgi:hypothetical protein
MNAASLHLAVNHVPVVGLPLIAVLLAAAAARRSRELSGAGFAGLALMAAAAFAALKTGGAAHEFMDGVPGVQHPLIHAHGHAARGAWYGALALGALGLGGLAALRRSKAFPLALTAVAVLGAAAVSVDMGWVAHLGGLIRHPEIASDYKPTVAAPDHDDDHDHDGGLDHEAAPHERAP